MNLKFSPAGGCLLSLCCDYRVMQGPKFTIGLNETLLGIVAPFWFKDTMLNTVGQRQTELALQLGTLFTADQALSIGLVDKVRLGMSLCILRIAVYLLILFLYHFYDSLRVQVVQDRETCLAEAHKMVSTMIKIPSEARHVSKMLMRQETLERLTKNKEADIEHFATFITQPVIQKPLGKYLEALKAKSKKK